MGLEPDAEPMNTCLSSGLEKENTEWHVLSPIVLIVLGELIWSFYVQIPSAPAVQVINNVSSQVSPCLNLSSNGDFFFLIVLQLLWV